MKVGDVVTLKGRKTKATILVKLKDIKGGVKLDRPLAGFSYWNVKDLEPVRNVTR